ncbi:STAS domain-containing protein [Streptomyces sp. R41]|uniref:STAS domain-containing protein n=1 Tax=Streptomyces sp. R41 TaxID=3238632 RepID=A0AB39RB41_9ACTN
MSAGTATPLIPAEVPSPPRQADTPQSVQDYCSSPAASAPGLRPVLAGVPEGREKVVVSGSLGLATVPGLRERLLGVCHGPGSLMILDLSGVTSCDTLGLGLLVATARRVHHSGGGLRLVAPSHAVVEALGDSGLIRPLHVLPNAGTPVGMTAAPELQTAAQILRRLPEGGNAALRSCWSSDSVRERHGGGRADGCLRSSPWRQRQATRPGRGSESSMKARATSDRRRLWERA